MSIMKWAWRSVGLALFFLLESMAVVKFIWRAVKKTLGADVIIRLSTGSIKGKQVDGQCFFRGIPYADCERWQAPTPLQPWEGVKACINNGPAAPQPTTMLNLNPPMIKAIPVMIFKIIKHKLTKKNVKTGNLSMVSGSEVGCLNLNVFTNRSKSELE
eukprot:gene10831-3275_t